MKSFIQHSPPHIGKILKEYYFKPLDLSINEATKKLRITKSNLSAIIKSGKVGMSPIMAVKLSKAFNTSPQYWMNIQASYELWRSVKIKKVE